MTAPGNSTMILTLLAVFVVCSGYAAGRLHQRYRTGRARDEAYREGYDTATRSVFSLAARTIGPRRDRTAVRASASVRPPSAPSSLSSPAPDPAPSLSSPPGQSLPAQSLLGRSLPGQSLPGQSLAAQSLAFAGDDLPAPSPLAPQLMSDSPAGRHTVPDELVRSVTYQLPPDRVARAKVPQVAPPPADLLDDGTSRVSVPKPRSS